MRLSATGRHDKSVREGRSAACKSGNELARRRNLALSQKRPVQLFADTGLNLSRCEAALKNLQCVGRMPKEICHGNEKCDPRSRQVHGTVIQQVERLQLNALGGGPIGGLLIRALS